ncbi:MAG: ATP-binding protein [Candidatus Methanomethylicaceae archaeon]|nr:ATP-binding protein [Candidatus Verstraetearchaeota archaeon]
MMFYEIFPTNFYMLPENRQNELLAKFTLFLHSIPSTIRVIIIKGKRGVEIEGRIVVIEHPTFYIECQESIDNILESTQFLFQNIDSIPIPKIRKEKWNYLILEDGRFAKNFTIYELPSVLPIGFLSELYDIADLIQFKITSLPSEDAVSKLENYKKTLNALILTHLNKKRSPPQNLLLKKEMVEATLQAIIMGLSKLFKISINFTIFASSIKELKEKSKQLQNKLSARLIKIDSPKFLQKEIYEGDGKKLYVESNTICAFYPFVTSEIIESGGIFLGINVKSGAPVVFNPLIRPNLNISIIGTSGSGKSFTTKIFLKRLLEKHPDMLVYIIDPEGEYSALMNWLGGETINISSLELGLDPLILFEKGEAADIICDATGLIDRKDISRIRDLIMSSNSLLELYNKLPSDLKEKFSSIINGPESFIFRGESLLFSPKMSFNMKGVESKFIKQLSSLLIFGKIWQIVSKHNVFGISKATPRLIIVDEAWLFMEVPSAAIFLEKVARLGRKRNCILIINTQRPADIIEKNFGRTILENSATKIIMKQDELNKKIMSEIFGLSNQEIELTINLSQGEGLLMTETTHIWVHFLASSDDEYCLFTTKPSESMTF